MKVKLKDIKAAVGVLSEINNMDLGDPTLNFDFMNLIDEFDRHLGSLGKFENKFKSDNDFDEIINIEDEQEKEQKLEELNEKYRQELSIVLEKEVDVTELKIPLNKLKGVPIKNLRVLNPLIKIEKD